MRKARPRHGNTHYSAGVRRQRYNLPYKRLFRRRRNYPCRRGERGGRSLGASLLNKLPEFVVNIVFVAVMLAAGLRMLF